MGRPAPVDPLNNDRDRKRWPDARALLDVNSTLAHLAGWDNLAVALRWLQRECEKQLEDWGAYPLCVCVCVLAFRGWGDGQHYIVEPV